MMDREFSPHLSKLFKSSQPPTLIHFPKDVVNEILLKLPVKSLLRFRCVSKLWRSLISSPQFVKSHLQSPSSSCNRLISLDRCTHIGFCTHILDDPKFATERTEEEQKGIIIPFKFPIENLNYDDIEIVGSCNGLICLTINRNVIMLFNPATRKSRVLPSSSSSDTNIVVRRIISCCGFGYEAFDDDFKVVESSFVNDSDRRTTDHKIKIYSLRTNSWKTVEWTHGMMVPTCSTVVFVNGAFHWQAFVQVDHQFLEQEQRISGITLKRRIVAINLAKDDTGTDLLQLPNYERNHVHGVFGASEQYLMSAYKYDGHVDIWMFVKESSNWVKFISFPCVIPDLMTYPIVLFVSENGEIIRKGPYENIVHKTSSSTIPFSCYITFGATTYRETLISPN